MGIQLAAHPVTQVLHVRDGVQHTSHSHAEGILCKQRCLNDAPPVVGSLEMRILQPSVTKLATCARICSRCDSIFATTDFCRFSHDCVSSLGCAAIENNDATHDEGTLCQNKASCHALPRAGDTSNKTGTFATCPSAKLRCMQVVALLSSKQQVGLSKAPRQTFLFEMLLALLASLCCKRCMIGHESCLT